MNKVYLKNNKIEVECSGIINIDGDEKCVIKNNEDYIISGEALSSIMLLLNKLPGMICIKSPIENQKEFQIAKTEEIEKLIKSFNESIQNYITLQQNYHNLHEKVIQYNKSCKFYERKIKL